MSVIIAIFLMTSVVVIFLCAVTIGLGFLLALVIPSLGISHTLTASAVITVFSAYCFLKLNDLVQERMAEEDVEEKKDGVDLETPGPVYIIPQSFIPGSSRRSKARKKRKTDDTQKNQ